MTSCVAEMDAQGQFVEWGLDEKIGFVVAMKESGYDMDESDWAILSDDTNPPQEREAAAERIVYERYGVVQEEANARRPIPKDSVIGNAPDAVEIFRERFLAEDPNMTIWMRWDIGSETNTTLSIRRCTARFRQLIRRLLKQIRKPIR